MEYLGECESGDALGEWLRANEDKYKLDYSKTHIKKYAVTSRNTYNCYKKSFDTLKEAEDYVANEYSNLVVNKNGKEVKLIELTTDDWVNSKGYYHIPYNIIDEEHNRKDINIAIIDRDTLFYHTDKVNGLCLANYMDGNRSLYKIVMGRE